MDNNQTNRQSPIYFEDLKLGNRMKLRREYNGTAGFGVLWLIVYFLMLILTVAGGGIFIASVLGDNLWQFSGLFFMQAGTFGLLNMLEMLSTKQKNLFKMLGTKKQKIRFFVSFTLLLVGGILIFATILVRPVNMRLHLCSLAVVALYSFVFLIPAVFSSRKNKDGKKLSITEQAKTEQDKFFKWLKNEKNILSKKHIENSITESLNDSAINDSSDDI